MGFGWTGPRVRRRALRPMSGSAESRFIDSSLPSLVLTSGYTVGLNLASGLGRGACTFVLLLLGGGVLVGYFRAVFVAESALAF